MIQRNEKLLQLLQESLINSREIVALLKEYNIAIGNLQAEHPQTKDTNPTDPSQAQDDKCGGLV